LDLFRELFLELLSRTLFQRNFKYSKANAKVVTSKNDVYDKTLSCPGGVVYVVAASPPDTEGTGAMGRDIVSREGKGLIN
jgi:hypothetical protein